MDGAVPGPAGPPAVGRYVRHDEGGNQGRHSGRGHRGNGTKRQASPGSAIEIFRTEKHGELTVAGYAPWWLSGHRLEPTSRSCYEAMLKHIIKGLGNITLADLDAPKVRTFIRGVEAGKLSASTVGLVMTALREMCRTAVIDGLMDRDPTSGIKIVSRRTREMRVLTPEEYRRLLDTIPAHYKLLVRTLTGTGLRWGEAMGLKGRDVQQHGSGYVIKVRRVLTEVAGKISEGDYGKTARATRDVTIDADLAKALIESAQQNPEGFSFRAGQGGELHRSNFRRIWIKTIKAAELTGVRVHDLRHTHASWLVSNGCDLVTVRDRLGHSDIKVTSRYLHVVPGERDRALAALGAALAA